MQDNNLQIKIPQEPNPSPSSLYPIDEVAEHEYTPGEENSERGSLSSNETPKDDVDGSTLIGKTIEVIQESTIDEQPLLEDISPHLPETTYQEPHFDDRENEDENDAGIAFGRFDIGTKISKFFEWLLSLTTIFKHSQKRFRTQMRISDPLYLFLFIRIFISPSCQYLLPPNS